MIQYWDASERLLHLHTLRAGDALQLAAATVASRQQPGPVEFACLDRMLAAAEIEEARLAPQE